MVPFHTYLLKVSSRCNINCTYCYIYNQADDRWKLQPRFMDAETVRRTCVRIREHLQYHDKSDCVVILHGGEPLLCGLQGLGMIASILCEELLDHGVRLTVGMQSNGLLFNAAIGDFLRAHGMTMGVSLDGPPDVNDIYRLGHRGQPTGQKLEASLDLLTREYRDVFSGFLTVLNPFTDPRRVTRYLLSYEPPGIDFIYPFNNHDRLPLGKQQDPDATPYGDWLIRSYDYWSRCENAGTIRIFRSIMNMWLGVPTLVESLGLLPVDLIVVETNGELEAVDSLKAAFQGATQLGFNVFENSFNQVAADAGVVARQTGVHDLCDQCKSCEVVEVCGGGYIPNRYSAKNAFRNPSVYCTDLFKLIHHIGSDMAETIGACNPAKAL